MIICILFMRRLQTILIIILNGWSFTISGGYVFHATYHFCITPNIAHLVKVFHWFWSQKRLFGTMVIFHLKLIPLHPMSTCCIFYLTTIYRYHNSFGIWRFKSSGFSHTSKYLLIIDLTHRDPVTQYCGGSILRKTPIFFTMKEFPQI